MDDTGTSGQHASLSIVLPTFNEASRIQVSLDQLVGWLESEGARALVTSAWDILVVDDGSTDETVAIVESRREAQASSGDSAARLNVLRRSHSGKGGAVAAGVLRARGDVVVFADADMATPPNQIPLLLSALADNDVALGSRVHPDGTDRRASQPLHRRILGYGYRLLTKAWLTGDIPDTQCGFKGFTHEAAQDIFSRLRTNSIAFDSELIFIARKLGYRVAVVPVQWSDIPGSRMGVRLSLAASVLWDLARIRVLHRRLDTQSDG